MHRMNEMLSKQEQTYKHDQLSARTTYSPSKWDLSTVDSCQTDGNHLSKLPSKVIPSFANCPACAPCLLRFRV
jgi:hypothetical protein